MCIFSGMSVANIAMQVRQVRSPQLCLAVVHPQLKIITESELVLHSAGTRQLVKSQLRGEMFGLALLVSRWV